MHRIAVSDVEIATPRGDNIVAGILATPHKINAELPACTGYQHAHLEAGPSLQWFPPGAVVAVPLDGGR